MSTLVIAQLVRETGCLDYEAANALEISGGSVPDARAGIETDLRFRRQKYGKKLLEVWKQYSQTTHTDYDGTIKLLTDLQLDFDDEVVLAIVYELGATQVGVFEQQKFIDGWSRLSCTTLPEMRRAVQKLALQLKQSQSYFARVYKNTFKYNLEQGHRLLDLETAQSYWQLLLASRYNGVEKWIEFTTKTGGKISADTWNMYLEFCEYVRTDPDLQGYDENASWPVIIDDFVEWLRS